MSAIQEIDQKIAEEKLEATTDTASNIWAEYYRGKIQAFLEAKQIIIRQESRYKGLMDKYNELKERNG